MSLPLRKCGLKFQCRHLLDCLYDVTSLAEVWIEIDTHMTGCLLLSVTSLAEVWIEIERDCQTIRRTLVTSLAEVWIEIASGYLLRCIPDRHFPRGSVD